MIDSLSRYMGVRVDVFDPFINISYNERVFSPQYVAQIRDFAAVAMGLGMREIGDS
ncbi:MAG: hypothetical protein KDD35_05260 [Bdellovibrionales bacterium]|nr:hypothetical protein [Bdellovibrionales bacterium]